MDNSVLYAEWMRRARSNLARVKAGRINQEITLEDLCFDAQQSAEKALKALCVSRAIVVPRTHNIGQLLGLLAANGCPAPAELDDVDALTEYAVTTRYPGDWDPVDENEFREALDMAERVFAWVKMCLDDPLSDSLMK